MKVKRLVFYLFARYIRGFFGPDILRRVGSMLTRAALLDFPNSIRSNGESEVQLAILKSGKPLTIVDCGANAGQWSSTLLASKNEKKSSNDLRLICFEPSSYTHKLLTTNLSRYAGGGGVQIQIERLALSSSSGNSMLHLAHDGAGINSLVGVPNIYPEQEEVQCTTLDEYRLDNDFDAIDLLKIDAEGHDLEVLYGARKLIENQAISIIQFEYNWLWIYSGKFLRNAFDFLLPMGYEIFKVTPLGLLEMGEYKADYETFIEGNYIASVPEYRGLLRII